MTNREPDLAEGKRAVVLGGAGFLGQRLVAFLAGGGGASHPEWPKFDSVHVFDCVPFKPREPLPEGAKVSSQVGDISKRSDVEQALRGAHTVFHLASIVDVGLRKNPKIDAVNVEGTRNVVNVAKALGVPYLVYTSSEDVVLNPVPIVHGNEDIPYPDVLVHDYVRTKIEGERIALSADTKGGLRTCSIRPVHLYGPHDPHAIKVSLKELGSGKVPFLLGDGSARFSIIYVDNVAHAHLLAAARLHDASTCDRVGGQAYFVGEDNHPNYFDFLRPYAEARGIRLPKRRLPHAGLKVVATAMEWVHRLLGVDVPFHRFHLYVIGQDFFFSHAKAERDLGYTPLVSKEDGQQRTVEWIVREPLEI